jgi:glycine cleavage system aminomethyltransferase T
MPAAVGDQIDGGWPHREDSVAVAILAFVDREMDHVDASQGRRDQWANETPLSGNIFRRAARRKRAGFQDGRRFAGRSAHRARRRSRTYRRRLVGTRRDGKDDHERRNAPHLDSS